MFGLMYKPGPTMMQRIRRALQGRVITGRHVITREVLGDRFSLDDNRHFNNALNTMIISRQVVGSRHQLAGTGHDGPPVFEYTYALRHTCTGAREGSKA